MAMPTITRNGNNLTGRAVFNFEFATAQTIGAVSAATRYGATRLVDKNGRQVPQLGDSLDSSISGLQASQIEIAPFDSKIWAITVTYSSSIDSRYLPGGGSMPWDELAVVRWSPLDEGVVFDRCYLPGDAKWSPSGYIRLPNGRHYFDPPIRPIAAAQAVITWNTENSIMTAIKAVEYSLNNAALKLGSYPLPIGTGYMKEITENKERLDDGTVFYSHSAIVYYRPDGHDYRPVAMDYYAIIDGYLKRVQIKDGVYGNWGSDPNATPVTDPVYLNASGGLLSTDPTATNITPVVQQFQIRPVADWSVLGIVQDD